MLTTTKKSTSGPPQTPKRIQFVTRDYPSSVPSKLLATCMIGMWRVRKIQAFSSTLVNQSKRRFFILSSCRLIINPLSQMIYIYQKLVCLAYVVRLAGFRGNTHVNKMLLPTYQELVCNWSPPLKVLWSLWHVFLGLIHQLLVAFFCFVYFTRETTLAPVNLQLKVRDEDF